MERRDISRWSSSNNLLGWGYKVLSFDHVNNTLFLVETKVEY
jgi:hypothetical protein